MNRNEEVKRHIELELWLKKNYPSTDSKVKALLFFLDTFDEIDAGYLFDAYLMPKEEIEKDIEIYDNSSIFNKIDELLFVDSLINKYDVTRSEIIKRIRDVRRINVFENSNIKVKKRKNNKNSCINL